MRTTPPINERERESDWAPFIVFPILVGVLGFVTADRRPYHSGGLSVDGTLYVTGLLFAGMCTSYALWQKANNRPPISFDDPFYVPKTATVSLIIGAFIGLSSAKHIDGLTKPVFNNDGQKVDYAFTETGDTHIVFMMLSTAIILTLAAYAFRYWRQGTTEPFRPSAQTQQPLLQPGSGTHGPQPLSHK